MNKIIKHKVNAANPRLSDEDPDPLEHDEPDAGAAPSAQEGWVPWTSDDLIDIRRIIEERLPEKERAIMEAFLAGQNNRNIKVSEKYWRYHFEKGITQIKKELGL